MFHPWITSYRTLLQSGAQKPHVTSLLSLIVATSLMAKEMSIDATMIPLEELIETKYIPASHIANQISNATSAVSIVTAQDIKDYGYRTLADILGSMRGLHIAQGYEYTFLAGRGFSSPAEYSGRIIVLIDGYRADDSLYGQAYLGNDGILDVSMIERVEYIPGGGSSGYSNGALLGAINIITKKGSAINGTQVAFGYGSQHAHQERVSVGETLDNGADILLSASTFRTHGRSFSYSDTTLGNISQNDDNGEDNKRFFLKTSYENLSLLAAYSKRNTDIPSYPFAKVDGDPIDGSDENSFVRLKYDTDLSKSMKLSSSFWYGAYTYRYADSVSYEDFINEGMGTARWHGADFKLIGTWFDNHILSLGTEYRKDQWRWYDYEINPVTYQQENTTTTRYRPRETYSVYVYDDFVLTPTLSLNYGARYENSDNNIHALSPHAALVWQALDTTVLKLSAGKSNRQATLFEGTHEKPERAKTLELVLEQNLGYETKLLGSLYRYTVSNRISSENATGDVEAKGAEIELEKHWIEGTRIRTSYAWQNAEEKNTGLTLINAPTHSAKFNLSTPILNDQLRMGLEVQYLGSRPLYTATREEYAPGHTLVNLNLLAHHIAPHLDANFLIRNVFDENYGDVVWTFSESQKLIHQSGRTFWLQLEYTFK